MATFRSNYLFGETFVTRISYGCPKYFLITFYEDHFDDDDDEYDDDYNGNEEEQEENGDNINSDHHSE